MSQKNRVLNFLQSGKTLTESNATKSGIGNVREIVRQLRSEGNAIYTNTGSNGTTTYRLGTPSKRMVAAAYNALGASAFN
jgi:hypothetical protein